MNINPEAQWNYKMTGSLFFLPYIQDPAILKNISLAFYFFLLNPQKGFCYPLNWYFSKVSVILL